MTSHNPFEVVCTAALELADLLAAQVEDAPSQAKAQLLERVNEIRRAARTIRP